MDLLTLIDGARKRASEKGTDVMREIASDIFEVPYADVTDEQRRYAKTAAYAYMYSPDAFSKDAQMRAQESQRLAELVARINSPRRPGKATAQSEIFRRMYNGGAKNSPIQVDGAHFYQQAIHAMHAFGTTLKQLEKDVLHGTTQGGMPDGLLTSLTSTRRHAVSRVAYMIPKSPDTDRLFTPIEMDLSDLEQRIVAVSGRVSYKLEPMPVIDIADFAEFDKPVREDKRHKQIYKRETPKSGPSPLIAALTKRIK